MTQTIVCLFLALAPAAAEQRAWRNPLKKLGYLNSPLVETTPFVYNDRLYLLENWQESFSHPTEPAGIRRADDVVRIRDLATDTVVASPLKGHGLGTAFVWDGRVYVFASEHDGGQGLVARGVVTAAEAIAKTPGIARQTPCVSVSVKRTAIARRPFGRSDLRPFKDWKDGQPQTELNFKFYRQATNKIGGISEAAAAFLDGFF